MDQKEINSSIEGYKKKINQLVEPDLDLQDEMVQNLSKELDEYITNYYALKKKKA